LNLLILSIKKSDPSLYILKESLNEPDKIENLSQIIYLNLQDMDKFLSYLEDKPLPLDILIELLGKIDKNKFSKG